MSKEAFVRSTCARALSAATCLILVVGIGAARAQQPPPAQTSASADTGGLEEVIVTATKRSQSVQNVPISVTAFTTTELQEKNLNDIHSLTALTPGVNLDAGSPFSGDSSVLSASIRGIGQDDFAFNLNPGVGVYVDGVFLARTIGANINLLDVDRVEILKGAQGTLFGANTIGGAISIVTHTPGNDFKITAEATGGSYNRRDLGFTVDVPFIPDTLLSTFTVSSRQQDGYQRVIPYPANGPVGDDPYVVDPQSVYLKAGYATGDDYGGTGTTTMRAKLLWNASDKLSVTFTGDWTHEDQTALPEVVLSTYEGNLASSTFSTLYDLCISNGTSTITPAVLGANGPPIFAGICSQPRAHVPSLGSAGGAALIGAGYVGVPVGVTPFAGVNPCYNYNNIAAGLAYCGSNQPRIFYWNETAQTGDYDTTYAANRPDFAKQDVFGFSMTGVYELSDTMSLKTITGYRQDKWDVGTQLDGTPETALEVTDQQHQYQVSEEVQLLGKALDNKLNYVAGLYYFNESGYVHDFVPFESILYVYDGTANDVQNKYYATFLHLDYAMTDQWEFIAGGRYTTAETFFVGGQGDLNSFPFGSYCWQNGNLAQCGAPVPYTDIIPNAWGPGEAYYRYFPATPDSQAWHVFTPMGTVQYHFSNDVMSYLTWGKGFKQGGWTTRLSAEIPSPTDARFGPEYAKQWELGVKSEWFNHHLLVNAAAFYTDYQGIQLNIQQGISPVYQNAGNAKIKGGELEFQSKLAGGLSLNGSASFIDAYYTSVNPSANIPEYALPDGTTVCPALITKAGTSLPACGLYNGPGNANGLPVVLQTSAKLPKTPKWKFAFDPEYDYALPNEATIRFIPVFAYTSEMYNDALNTPLLRRPATRSLDASLHYISATERYDFAIGGTNLTDDRYFISGATNYGAGVAQGYINAPREWYATIRVMLDSGRPAEVAREAVPAPEPAVPPPPPPVAAPPPPPPPAPPPPPEVVLKGVNFETGSAVLLPASSAALDQVVVSIKGCQCHQVAIRGYTDSVGKPPSNQLLSDRRAHAVKDYLVEHGVAADMLVAEGFGQANPIASNDTADGRAQNRRVTVQFSEMHTQ
jgi:iron complex outermembrane recepter protein